MGRLLPDARGLTDGHDIYSDLELPTAPSGRPYVVLNMVTSVDGRVSSGGKASGIGSRVDRACMRVLRSKVDAVAVGAGSLRAEKMDLGLDHGYDPQPLAVIIGGSDVIPLAQNLLTRDQELLVALAQGAQVPDRSSEGAPFTVLSTPVNGDGRVDLRYLLKSLREGYGVRRLLVEGGPSVNRSLLEEGLVDEVFMTVAPKLVLGREHAVISGGPERDFERELEILSVHHAGHELFLRYRILHNRD